YVPPVGSTAAEIWKPIEGFQYYSVSDHGRIKSCKGSSPRILKPNIDKDGYHRFSLYKQQKVYYFSAHYLVLITFVGPRPSDCEASHKDGIKSNNRPSNLEWIPHSLNLVRSFELGRKSCKGERGPNVKLKNEDVIEIRRLAEHGVSRSLISKMFKVSQQNIDSIITRKRWSHI
ncbi:unnamed protein product, partial [marine sediment metagenome]